MHVCPRLADQHVEACTDHRPYRIHRGPRFDIFLDLQPPPTRAAAVIGRLVAASASLARPAGEPPFLRHDQHRPSCIVVCAATPRTKLVVWMLGMEAKKLQSRHSAEIGQQHTRARQQNTAGSSPEISAVRAVPNYLRHRPGARSSRDTYGMRAAGRLFWCLMGPLCVVLSSTIHTTWWMDRQYRFDVKPSHG